MANTRPYEGSYSGVHRRHRIGYVESAPNRVGPENSFAALILPLDRWTPDRGRLAFYNERVFGKPWILPYQLNRATYAVAPVFRGRPFPPCRNINHKRDGDFYMGWEVNEYNDGPHRNGALSCGPSGDHIRLAVLRGPGPYSCLFVMLGNLRDARIRFLMLTGVFLVVRPHRGVFFNPHMPPRNGSLFLFCWCRACGTAPLAMGTATGREFCWFAAHPANLPP